MIPNLRRGWQQHKKGALNRHPLLRFFPGKQREIFYFFPRHITSPIVPRISQDAIHEADSSDYRSDSRLARDYAGDPSCKSFIVLPWHFRNVHAGMHSERFT